MKNPPFLKRMAARHWRGWLSEAKGEKLIYTSKSPRGWICFELVKKTTNKNLFFEKKALLQLLFISIARCSTRTSILSRIQSSPIYHPNNNPNDRIPGTSHNNSQLNPTNTTHAIQSTSYNSMKINTIEHNSSNSIQQTHTNATGIRCGFQKRRYFLGIFPK